MEYINIIFPYNIGPLTYRCPEELAGRLKPGMLINAPLKNRIHKGIFSEFIRETTIKDAKPIKDILSHESILTTSLLNLLKWASYYYFSEQGLILKHILPKETFITLKKINEKSQIKTNSGLNTRDILNIKSDSLQSILESLNYKIFKTFLLHAPSLIYEYSFITNIIKHLTNVIILAPDINSAEFFYPVLKEIFGERLCLYHSKLSKGIRSNALKRIINGNSDILLGTKSVVFLPMKIVKLIIVLNEHSQFYKQECHPYYNARDVAVKRGFFENAVVLLTSLSPSIESIYNCKNGKYTLLDETKYGKQPKIKLINISKEKLVKPFLSLSIFQSSKKHLEKNHNIFFVLNRKGYFITLHCIECNKVISCPTCEIPLVYYKNEKILKCQYCGFKHSEIPEICPNCKGFNLKFSGAGTQRLQEDLEKLLNIKTVRIDRDSLKNKRHIERFITTLLSENIKVIVGTKLITKSLISFKTFTMGSFLNPDSSLNRPDFRAAEKLYQEIILMKEYIKDDGELYIQTKTPYHYIYKSIKENNYIYFLKEELLRRKTLNYPPFSKLALIKINTKEDIFKFPKYKPDEDTIILGPSLFKSLKNKKEYRLLIKSPSRKKLYDTIIQVIKFYNKIKPIEIRIDVDPTTF